MAFFLSTFWPLGKGPALPGPTAGTAEPQSGLKKRKPAPFLPPTSGPTSHMWLAGRHPARRQPQPASASRWPHCWITMRDGSSTQQNNPKPSQGRPTSSRGSRGCSAGRGQCPSGGKGATAEVRKVSGLAWKSTHRLNGSLA